MNELLPEWDPLDVSPHATLRINQAPCLPEFPTLRRHKMKVAFFTRDGTAHTQDVLVLNQAQTTLQYDGSREYRAVLLNYEDETFVKVLLDEASLLFFRDHLHTIQDTLTRQLIWRAFFDLQRDAKISSEEYADIMVKCLPAETSDDIVQVQIMYLESALHASTPRPFQRELAKRVFHFLVDQLRHLTKHHTEHNQNRMILFRDKLFSFCLDDDAVHKLLAWRAGHDNDLRDVPLTNNTRWSIVEAVHASPS